MNLDSPFSKAPVVQLNISAFRNAEHQHENYAATVDSVDTTGFTVRCMIQDDSYYRQTDWHTRKWLLGAPFSGSGVFPSSCYQGSAQLNSFGLLTRSGPINKYAHVMFTLFPYCLQYLCCLQHFRVVYSISVFFTWQISKSINQSIHQSINQSSK